MLILLAFTRFLVYNNGMKTTAETITIPLTEYEALKALKAEVAELTQKVEWFMGQFKLSQHRRFGSSSEKSEYDQADIFNEAEATADIHAVEPELVEIEKHYRKRKRLVNDRLPENLPVEIVEHDLPNEEQVCPECSDDLHMMGQETHRELVVIPARIKIREHIRKVYACRNCEKDEHGLPIQKAPITNPVIKGSFASPEAIAHIMCQKFVMGSPLYRQEQDWNRQGIMLSRQTMSNWVIRATEDWLYPVYDALREILLSYDNLHADETTLQVLREPGKPAQSKSYMWLYRTGRYNSHQQEIRHPIILYDYQPDRRAKRPAEFLKGFEGFVHADGYEVYHNLSEKITIVGCFAHLRRKFDEALKMVPEKDRIGSNALQGKSYCDKLFELERKFADLTPEERYAKRQELSKPLIDELFMWLKPHQNMAKTPIGAAARYAFNQRKYLENYLLDGRLEISNNRAERSIKPFVINRKNFLFANTPRGAKASAVMLSIIETAKECGLNPFDYLVYIFTNAPNWDIRNNNNIIDLLMPHSAPDLCKTQRRETDP
jgi:transposase